MEKFAVLVPFVKTEYGEAILLEVRSDKVKQPGEICFPGGRSEQGETAAETAVRETCEELGIRTENITAVTEREPLIMGDGRIVYPVTAQLDIKDIESLTLSEDEVAAVFLLPLQWLREQEPDHFDLAETDDGMLPDILLGYLSHYGSYRRTGKTDYLEYEGHGIWGLTARILLEL